MEEVITQETVPEVPLESTTEGGSADASQSLLETLNETLGKDFKDAETALKSVKDTFSYVGKQDDLINSVKGVMKETGLDETAFIEKLKSMSTESKQEAPVEETKSPEVDISALEAKMQAQYQEDRFFDKNEGLANLKDYIKPLKNSTDEFKSMSWDEFAKTDAVAKLSETFSGYEEANSKKSVVESNPRLGAISDKMNTAREAQKSGDFESAKETAVSAVVDSILDE